ncbi:MULTISPECIES: class I SAM-dependent methyltransferase [Streptomyces]|uniref:class I SAM-dependent methyltransferase n=1 Tax=Streptomyces TaxID=1883 RepID=UPI001903BEAB|nr:class I SAM-dependent methyltransferase [Streptomyces sp. XC 2026]QQN76555.1 class I SAM-dependent methyltransferase [Streptomyces sp. XC 2026]
MNRLTPSHPLPVDPVTWPDVAAVPAASRPRVAVTERLVRRAVSRLPLRVVTPDGPLPGPGGPRIEIHDPAAFHRRLGTSGTIGFGESYLAGEWDAPDLVAALTVVAGHAGALIPAPLQRLRGWWAPPQPASQHNAPDDARENIRRHYDLSNDLFALFLDPTLTYSSAVFRTLPARWDQLEQAQHRKIDRLLDLAGAGPGTRLLEIGTGWGELAVRAARRGAHVDTITLSAAQRDLALRKVAEAGVADRVEIRLQDYRDLSAHPGAGYDAVVSVEMIEAVGVRGWPGYFRALDRVLAPGGRIALQAITMPHDRMVASHTTHTWIQKYIFPGGQLPSTEAITDGAARHAGLTVARRERYGPHYAETLRLWRERFTEQAPAVEGLGFDDTFRRMWTFYLAYCEAGFRSGYLDVQQFQLLKGGPR